MKNTEHVQALWERIKKPNVNLADLSTLLEDYKGVLGNIMAGDEDYRSSLRRLHEELPDLQRLVGKKHDAILKGRMQDAIGALKNKIDAGETPPEPETQTPALLGSDAAIIALQEEQAPKPSRNMPNIGMD